MSFQNQYARQARTLLTNPNRLWGRLFGPRALVLSVPKSGTNMLMQTLRSFPALVSAGTIHALSVDEQLLALRSLRPGEVVSTHTPWNPRFDSILAARGIKPILISRDPRDVCVSMCYYILREPRHPRHRYYHSLPDMDARLSVTITGCQSELSEDLVVSIPSIRVPYTQMESWYSHPSCLIVTFESLVGPMGGGTADLQKESIRRIARHLDMNPSESTVDSIAQQVFSPSSATFRRGQIGSWRAEFNRAHVEAFKDIAGALLVELGYESDTDWAVG